MRNKSSITKTIFVLFTFIVFGLPLHSFGQKNLKKPTPKLVTLDQGSTERIQILHGPPETVTMHSGYMVLAPSKSVGRHSTKDNEEAIVVLAGAGEMRIVGGPTFHLLPYCVAYCPPNTEHDVTNIGTDTLRYVYIVARAQK